jgi:flavin reductase (DIM6/NTAB) family NADH-FMN oxidoreductase RutF
LLTLPEGITIQLVDSRRAQIGAAIARIPSGCFVLTAAHEGRSTGVLVSWVQQASFDPPAVSVCLKHGRPVIPLIEASGRFLLNVLSTDATALFRHFGRGFGPEDDPFAGLTIEPTEFGPLLRACVAHLGCRVIQKVPVGDHDLYVGEVILASVSSDQPSYTHMRKNGMNY